MVRKLETSDLSLGELFSGERRFRIPAYQREYAWELEHARELLDDLTLAMVESAHDPEDSPYFLGSMLTYKDAQDSATDFHDVVDGQQRMVTLAIIFACLRDLDGETGDVLDGALSGKDGPLVLLRPADQAFFVSAVSTPGATGTPAGALADDRSPTHENIITNRNDLRRTLRRMAAAERDDLARYILEHCRVVLMEADNFDYAYQIFLSINARGKDLSIEDIFQAELLGPLDETQQKRYAPIIGQVGKYRRENQRSVSRGKTFFSHLAFANGWQGKTIVNSIHVAIKAAGGPGPFAQTIFVPVADAYLALTGLEPVAGLPYATAVAIEHLQMLEAHGDDDWLPTAMLAWQRLPHDSDDLALLLTGLDRYSHLLSALGFGVPERKRRYRPINEAIRRGEPWPGIFKMLSMSKRDERGALRNIARRLHISDKATCRLFLLRIDAHLAQRPLSYYRALPEYVIGTDDAFTVEHLLPKGKRLRGKGAKDWEKAYPDQDYRQVCAQYLGNLALVTQGENAAMGQEGFERKKLVLTAGRVHPLLLTDQLREHYSWRHGDILKRHRLMMSAVCEIWQLDGNWPEPPAPPTRGGGKAA